MSTGRDNLSAPHPRWRKAAGYAISEQRAAEVGPFWMMAASDAMSTAGPFH